ncbi:protein FAR1-RELATED SEQUENCE 5-like [Silene latifolia]|uniref:protein FAR1-RELATED SEQUENCE 5-like n=1 Tax=Silene latifolia TaxID=37657 RepID=UPI003D772542
MMRVEAVESGGYRVDQFVAVHNRRLLSVIYKEFHKVVRQLSGFQKTLINDNSKLNIGADRSFQLCKVYADGYANVGATLTDFMNFARDVKYAECRRNYSIFGDGLSYDATYETNKYRMKFTPFTGVDHHKRSLTFAYQDPGMLLAIPKVFKTACHRFCMWHIMEKVSVKVGAIAYKETDFLSRLNSIMWDSSLEPMEFEQKWLEVMKDFDLGGHKWLSSMFCDKHLWIPVFFTDMRMGGLLRTSQRSESANSFFKHYRNHYGTLVEFWLRYEIAIEQQRYLQKCLDKDSEHSLPVTTPSPTKIKLHAASVYTHKTNLLKSIPGKYIVPRWCKVSYRNPFSILPENLVEDCEPADVINMEISNVWSEFYSTISVAKTLSVDRIKELAATLKAFREEVSPASLEILSKEKEIEQLLGFTNSSEVTILPPKISNNKDSGKRLLSTGKEAIAKSQKPKRLCACCKEMVNHDKRNCPKKDIYIRRLLKRMFE